MWPVLKTSHERYLFLLRVKGGKVLIFEPHITWAKEWKLIPLQNVLDPLRTFRGDRFLDYFKIRNFSDQEISRIWKKISWSLAFANGQINELFLCVSIGIINTKYKAFPKELLGEN